MKIELLYEDGKWTVDVYDLNGHYETECYSYEDLQRVMEGLAKNKNYEK